MQKNSVVKDSWHVEFSIQRVVTCRRIQLSNIGDMQNSVVKKSLQAEESSCQRFVTCRIQYSKSLYM